MGDPRQPLLPALGAVLLALGACDLGASGLASLDGGTDAAGGRDAAPDSATSGGADATDSPATPPVDAGVDAFDAANSAGSNDAGVDACAAKDGGTSDTVVAAHATSAPSIDGRLDDWPCPDFSILSSTTGYSYAGAGGPASPNISASFAVEWDATHLYFAAVVTDPTLVGTSAQPWQNDAVEIYVSNDAPPNGDYSADDRQFVVDYRNFQAEYRAGTQETPVVGLTSAVVDGSGSYTVEASVDVTVLGVASVSGGQSYGFDLQVDDDTGGASQANVYVWHASPGTNCGCTGGCCCTFNPQLPSCSTLAFGAVTLAP